MRSHSVTFHPTQVNTSQLNRGQTGRYLIYLPWRNGRTELTLVVGYIPRWLICQQTVTHPGSNRARCIATMLIETNVLTTTPWQKKIIKILQNITKHYQTIPLSICITVNTRNGDLHVQYRIMYVQKIKTAGSIY